MLNPFHKIYTMAFHRYDFDLYDEKYQYYLYIRRRRFELYLKNELLKFLIKDLANIIFDFFNDKHEYRNDCIYDFPIKKYWNFRECSMGRYDYIVRERLPATLLSREVDDRTHDDYCYANSLMECSDKGLHRCDTYGRSRSSHYHDSAGGLKRHLEKKESN